MTKNIMVLNNSGNVGKTWLVREILYPYLNADISYEIETKNDSNKGFSGIKVKSFDAKDEDEFVEIYNLMLDDEQVKIFDVGSGDVKEFINQFKENEGVFEFIDMILIPTVPSDKELEDTVVTLEDLAGLDVDFKKVRVIFNKIEDLNKNLEAKFPQIFSKKVLNLGLIVDKKLVLKKDNFFNKLAKAKITTNELVADKTDYLALRKEANTNQEKLQFAEMDLLKRKSKSVKKILDTFFDNLIESFSCE